MYVRYLSLDTVLKRKSVFLFGPRQTGKSTFLKSKYPQALYINLLMSKDFLDFQKDPGRLAEVIRFHLQNNSSSLIIIDEIQKIPQLLDEVHDQIEKNKNLRFILTGSSARKLKRGAANLLGGRASWVRFHPLVYSEMGADRNSLWLQTLQTGGLPPIINSSAPNEDLMDYVGLYLKEEIQTEGFTRSLQNFSRFLEVAALTNAEQLNYAKIGNDVQLSPSTVRDYYQILQDTLLGEQLPAFLSTSKRKAMTTSKFYFFDCGVCNALLNRRNLTKGTPEYGKSLEQAVYIELRTFIDYHRLPLKLEYWRSTSHFEVDFLIYSNLKNIIAIEVKAGSGPSKKDLKGLLALEEERPLHRKIVICNANRPRTTQEGVEILPLLEFLESLWAGKII